MAVAKKASKLDSTLPKPRSIRFFEKKAGTGMFTKCSTATDRTWKRGLCVRQANKAAGKYGMQVQYRDATVKADGKVKYSKWKNAKAFNLSANAKKFNVGANKPFPAGTTRCNMDAEYLVGYWLTPNVGASAKTEYMTVWALETKTFATTTQKRIFQVRARTYDPNANTHSDWLTQELTVLRASVVRTESQLFYKATDGGILATFDATKSLGAASVRFNSIRDSRGNELLKDGAFTATVKGDDHNPASGYAPYCAKVAGKRLTRAVTYGEKLRLDATFKNSIGASTQLVKTFRVVDTAINKPKVVLLADLEIGAFKVVAARSDSDDAIGSATCEVTIGDKSVSTWANAKKLTKLKATNVKKNISGTQGTTEPFAVWEFRNVPLGTNVYVNVSASPKRTDVANASATKFIGPKKLTPDSYIFSGVTFPKVIASCWGDVEPQSTGSGYSKADHCIGGGLPFAVIGKGRSLSMSLSGTVFAKDELSSTSTIAKWENVQKHLGVYTYRDPYGKVLNVLVTNVRITRKKGQYANIAVTFEEVQ